MPDRDHLHGEPEPVVIAAPQRDRPPFLIVQVENR